MTNGETRTVRIAIVWLALALAGASCGGSATDRAEQVGSDNAPDGSVTLDVCEKAALQVLKRVDPNGTSDDAAEVMKRESTTDVLIEACGDSYLGSLASDLVDCVDQYGPRGCDTTASILFVRALETLNAKAR